VYEDPDWIEAAKGVGSQLVDDDAVKIPLMNFRPLRDGFYNVPVARRAALRLAWSTGMTTRVGSDFDTLSAGLQVVWFRGS
jgi:hypothetical protein